jgi:hypothetical protein
MTEIPWFPAKKLNTGDKIRDEMRKKLVTIFQTPPKMNK